MKNKGKLYSIALAALLLFFLIFGSSVALAGTETRLTHGERLTASTAIYGTNVFWTETTANGVHAYDLATGKRTDINGNYAVEKINAYGNKVVWTGDDGEAVYMYDSSTGNETKIASGRSLPDIYGNYIVYTNAYNDDHRYDGIYLYDLNSHKETKIANAYSSPAIYDTKVLWSQANSNNSYDTREYNISTNQTSTIATTSSVSELDTYGNVTVWIESGNVYLYDSASHKKTQVTNSGNASQPAIYGKRIVYAVGDLYQGNIYIYEISTAKKTRITTSTMAFSPSIYEDKIIYADLRNPEEPDARDIYLYNLSSTVQNPPVAEFYAKVTSGTVPLVVLFTETSTGGIPTSWLWNFGDGIDSKHAMNATHTFTKPGVYNVTLTVANEAGNSTVTKSNYITVTPPQAPLADFATNVTSGTAPLTVLFAATGIGEAPTSWYWDFGDGINSKNATVIHAFTKPGNYTISLTVGNIIGNNTVTKPGYIVVTDPNAPVANFSSNVTEGYAPLVVQFNDISQKATSRIWDLNGDGQPDSSDIDPVYVYANSGTYSVNLTVSNENGTASKTAAINVLEESSSSSGSSGGSSHSSGGSGGSAGGSPEPQSNIEAKELSHTFILKGLPVTFDFPQKATAVVSINFDSKKTVGKTTTIAEMLKNKSSLVSGVPADEVYKYLNIWVGNGGYATEKNIENAVVSFKVSQSWVNDKKIDKKTIALNRYSDNTWNKLTTKLSNEDDSYLYFTAQTPGFSPFAITGKAMEKEAETEIQSKPNTQDLEQNNGSTAASLEQTTAQKESPNTSGKGSTGMPGFEIVSGIVCLLGVFLYKRK